MTGSGERRSRLAPPKPLADPSKADQKAVESVLSRARTRDADPVAPTLAQLERQLDVRFTLPLDPLMAAKIDMLRRSPIRMTRIGWIRQAIQEKIDRDGP